MADTIRTQTALLTTLFQDGQANNSITAQDIRDAIVSLSSAYGEINTTTAVATTIAAANTFVKEGGTTTLGLARGVTMSTNNRLTYTQAPARIFQVVATLTATSAVAGQTLAFRLAKNGSTIANSEVSKTFTLNTDEETVSLSALVSLATTDYIELFVANETAINNLTVTNMTLSMLGVI